MGLNILQSRSLAIVAYVFNRQKESLSFAATFTSLPISSKEFIP